MAGLLTFSVDELRVLLAVVLVVLLTFIPAVVWCAWRQEAEIRRLEARLADVDADVAVLWRHTFGDHDDDQDPGGGGPDDDPTGPIDDEPPTLTADPADTWARQTALLDRYQHHGQHRG